ncbi:hypothetical protein QFC24_000212 [Naganishia onofrii]|uniref:Uncharacterized protein n=1 Tax=Naganishia onofrii TaxID=1851511 RepID=A0ACC2XVE1_9TREE|nr:hypothetical protein QFC24_000212 [Naganishia onofrii]
MATSTTSTQTGKTTHPEHEDSRLASLKNNVSYLAYGSAAGAAAVPASLKTRTLLKTTRYVLKYIFYRLIRYGKYVVIGSIGAALGGSLLASIASGAAFIVAPSALVSTGIGIGWAVLKFAWNHKPASLQKIQSEISSLLRLSPTATQSIATSNLASSSTPPRKSFFSSAGERAREGHDARSDERADQEHVNRG